MEVVSTDADEPKNANSDVRYKILSQDPLVPNNAFSINPVTGDILVNSAGLDKEVHFELDLNLSSLQMYIYFHIHKVSEILVKVH